MYMQFLRIGSWQLFRLAVIVPILVGVSGTVFSGGNGETLERRLEPIYRDVPQVIEPGDVYQMILSGAIPEDAYLVDVRSREEWTVSHLPQAEIVPFDGFDPTEIDHIPRGARIILYCAVGRRSGSVGEELRSAGYTDVWDMYGGVLLWAERGYPLVDENGSTTRVHGRRRWYGRQITNDEVDVVY